MPPTPSLTHTADLTGPPAGSDDEDFELDLRLIHSAIPITKLMCSTNDGCGSSCCSSACTTNAADPFSF
jgi:FxLD family lantipeptide